MLMRGAARIDHSPPRVYAQDGYGERRANHVYCERNSITTSCIDKTYIESTPERDVRIRLAERAEGEACAQRCLRRIYGREDKPMSAYMHVTHLM